ncbi:hypothetical protein JAAARDRAFT_60702 [Jaapia argillacea MUCL 33604]|uniref:DUF6699 domain-containing protein n=1 Tax=Jaapia argillacea MUCL 33604 TaxID=933084 RepID=A0A067PSL9_9AGAM|nr:hypothetical protein JAAARDRAFT_60702 [Jaapia argillacea MUCL 33604]
MCSPWSTCWGTPFVCPAGTTPLCIPAPTLPTPGGYIAPAYRPVDSESYNDPVTGARLIRRRPRPRANASRPSPPTIPGYCPSGYGTPYPSPYLTPYVVTHVATPYTPSYHLPPPMPTPQTPLAALPGHNPGIQVDDGPAPPQVTSYVMTSIPQIQPTTPYHDSTPDHITAMLGQQPSQAWTTPAGHLAWTPHPHPHPTIPASTWWNPRVLGAPYHSPFPATLSPAAALMLTGGHPMPGTAPNWQPGAWPPVGPSPVPIQLHPRLVPNPNDGTLPHVVWDVTQPPSLAKKITGRHIVLDMTRDFGATATHPPVKKMFIQCDFGHMHAMWSDIIIDQTEDITVWDVMEAIYEFFQTPMKQSEVDFISNLSHSNYEILCDAYRRRCHSTPGLQAFELLQGIRRVDVLGDRRVWWGTWITYHNDGTWRLNLGLVPLRRTS